jgi:thioesterase domain-containing protein
MQEAQPTGPYRVGGYSAGGFMACRIAKLLEAHGDEVIQLALIDNSPFLGVIPRAGDEYAPETDFADVPTLRAHQERGVRGLCTMMCGYKDQ